MQIENPRMDFASRQRFPKSEMLRLLRVDGRLVIDRDFNQPGRGYYLHKDGESFLLAKRKKAFERLLHRPLTDEEEKAILEAIHE